MIMETMNLQAYLIYLPIALLITILVARKLFENSKIFMIDIFRGREEIANATNSLFEIGFYLLNIGMALLILEISQDILSSIQMVEILSVKIGGFAIYLGVALFANVYLFFRGKRKASLNTLKDKMI